MTTGRYSLFRAGRVALLAAAALTGASARAAPLLTPPSLMPIPKSVAYTGATRPIGGMTIRWDGRAPTPLLKRAAARFLQRLAALAGPGGGTSPVALHIRYGVDPDYLTLHEKERYTLAVAPGGVELRADGPAGVLRGLATLLQLVRRTPEGPVLTDASIDDAPRFLWRGLMIDVARHFLSVETMKRQLDAMELVKLNVLHWHLSDGTGFRVESLRYPKLQQIGGHDQYYTQAQVREIIAYAADRGIRIVPEFDIPGHTLAILQAYPGLAAQQPVPLTPAWLKTCQTDFSKSSSTTSCPKHLNLNNAALDPTNPDVLRFAEGLYAEMGHLFPDRYFHSGGDEVSPDQWTGNPAIAAYMKAHGYADAPAIQAAFTARVEQVLARQGKIMMGWDEVSEAPIPKDVVVEVWRSSKWTGLATAGGHPVVVSAGYYLDLLRPSRTHYAVDPFDLQSDGFSPAEGAAARAKMGAMVDAFTLDPAQSPLTDAQKSLVLGGEAPLWSEVVTDEMEDARLWPRSAAIAERFWSPETVRDVDDMERRLPDVLAELEATGLLATQHDSEMIDRLTPGNVTPLRVLTAATRPVMNYALNRLVTRNGDAMLTGPAAIAAPDSLLAIRFNRLAARYAAGDRGVAADLRALLTPWAANDAAYRAVATTPLLKEALPVSHLLSALARTGLAALQPGGHDAAWRSEAERQIAAAQSAYDSCSRRMSTTGTLPPSGLLIGFLPGVRALVTAAR